VILFRPVFPWIIALLVFTNAHAVDVTKVPDINENLWPYTVSWNNSTGQVIREQYVGPFFETRAETEETYFALRPFFLERQFVNNEIDTSSFSILYPLFIHREYHGHSQWSVFSLIRSSKITTGTQRETDLVSYYKKSFEVFPFYFDYESWNPDYSYFGIFPLFGELKNRIFYDRISWFAFPFYSKWEDNDETTYAYLWPFVKYRTGPVSNGFGIWPLFGNFERENDYHLRYALWPFLYYNEENLDQQTPETHIGMLPLYARETRQSYTREDFLWPFFGYTLDTLNEYEEARFLWPVFVQGRGNNRYLNQIAPLYSISKRNGNESRWFLWPLFNTRQYELNGIDTHKFKFLYFIYQDTTQTVANQPESFLGTKRHFWPIFSYWKTNQGTIQFQMFSPLEPLFPNSSEIRRLYSPLFSIVRYQELSPDQKDLELLFSLIHFQRRPGSERFDIGPILGYENNPDGVRLELLKGLLGYREENRHRFLRLLWFSIDLGEKKEKGEESNHE